MYVNTSRIMEANAGYAGILAKMLPKAEIHAAPNWRWVETHMAMNGVQFRPGLSMADFMRASVLEREKRRCWQCCRCRRQTAVIATHLCFRATKVSIPARCFACEYWQHAQLHYWSAVLRSSASDHHLILVISFRLGNLRVSHRPLDRVGSGTAGDLSRGVDTQTPTHATLERLRVAGRHRREPRTDARPTEHRRPVVVEVIERSLNCDLPCRDIMQASA